MIKVLLIAVIALSALVPVHYVATGMLAFWAMQRLLPEGTSILVHAGPVELSAADLILLGLVARFGWTVIQQKAVAVNRELYLAIGCYLSAALIASVVAGLKFGEAQFTRCIVSWARFALEILLVPITAQAVRNLPQARKCVWLVLGTLTLLAAIQMVNYVGASHGIVLGEVQGAERGELRYFGPVGDSIGMVLLLGYVASLCFASISGVALFAGGILLTAGFGAILAAVVATLLFAAAGFLNCELQNSWRKAAWLVPLAGFGAVLLFTFGAQSLVKTLVDRFATGTYESSSEQRAASAELAGAIILDNPLLGAGYMGYERALSLYGGDRYFDLEQPNGATANANNQLLQTLTDGGICGLLALGILVFLAGKALLDAGLASDDRLLRLFFMAAFIWLLAQLLGNVAAVWLNPSSFVARLLWTCLGLAVAAVRLSSPDQAGAIPGRGIERIISV